MLEEMFSIQFCCIDVFHIIMRHINNKEGTVLQADFMGRAVITRAQSN